MTMESAQQISAFFDSCLPKRDAHGVLLKCARCGAESEYLYAESRPWVCQPCHDKVPGKEVNIHRNTLYINLWRDEFEVTQPEDTMDCYRLGSLHCALVIPIPSWPVLWYYRALAWQRRMRGVSEYTGKKL